MRSSTHPKNAPGIPAKNWPPKAPASGPRTKNSHSPKSSNQRSEDQKFPRPPKLQQVRGPKVPKAPKFQPSVRELNDFKTTNKPQQNNIDTIHGANICGVSIVRPHFGSLVRKHFLNGSFSGRSMAFDQFSTVAQQFPLLLSTGLALIVNSL